MCADVNIIPYGIILYTSIPYIILWRYYYVYQYPYKKKKIKYTIIPYYHIIPPTVVSQQYLDSQLSQKFAHLVGPKTDEMMKLVDISTINTHKP